jgi:hypothetical protein
MPRLAWMKKAAALLLLVCFVLPLSKCTPKMEEGPVVSDPQVSYQYGYLMALDGLDHIDEGGDAGYLLALAIVFFVPAIALLLKESWQSLIQFGAAFPALHVLYGWLFVMFSEPQIGGILAAECWLFLLTASASTLWSTLRGRRKLRAAAPST